MDNRGNGIDYIIEKSSIPEEFKDIAEAQSKNTCDILKQRTERNKIKIVGPCSKWVEGEGWVTEIPVKLIGEKVEEMVKESKPTEGFDNTFWLLMLAYIFSNNQNNCKYNDNGHCKIEKGSGDFNECQRMCEYFKEDK